MIRRKSFDDEEQDNDRWLVSYADFITLLFAFFVVMYGISSVNQKKYNQLTSSIGTAFSGSLAEGGHINGPAGSPNPSVLKSNAKSFIKPLPLSHLYEEKMRREREAMTKTGLDLSHVLAGFVQSGKVQVLQNNRGVRIDINDSLLFQPGSAELAPESAQLVSDIAQVLKDNQRAIQVEGHTDNIPIHNPQFFSNWELSAVRASTVVRTLNTAGIAENRLSALGFGSSQPLQDNDTPENRAKNRRVSLMILYTNPADDKSDSLIAPQ